MIGGIKWLTAKLHFILIPQKQVIWCDDLTKMDAEGFVLPENLKIERYYSIDQISKEDLESFLQQDSDLMGSASSKLLRERLSKGAALWLLKENNHVCGYWWTIANNHVTPTYLPHIDTDVHAIGVELFESFRGRGHLFRHFIKAIQLTLKEEGFKRYYAETYLTNKRALNAIFNVGEHKVGTASRFSLFGKNVVIWHEMSETRDIEPKR
jgi:hypothetical protein